MMVFTKKDEVYIRELYFQCIFIWQGTKTRTHVCTCTYAHMHVYTNTLTIHTLSLFYSPLCLCLLFSSPPSPSLLLSSLFFSSLHFSYFTPLFSPPFLPIPPHVSYFLSLFFTISPYSCSSPSFFVFLFPIFLPFFLKYVHVHIYAYTLDTKELNK